MAKIKIFIVMLLTLFTKPFFRALCSTVLLGILFFTPATAADVSAISADPGPTGRASNFL